MFGYIICDKKGIDKAELVRYRSFYCGICRELMKYGRAERMSLNYDMTFLAIFLSALYEPEEITEKHRCIVHPAVSQTVLENRFTEYAAAMTIALSYHKALDDWADEKKLKSRKYAEKIQSSYMKVREKYPRQCSSIENSLNMLHRIETDSTLSADDAINAAGMLLSELFVYREDFWYGDLKQFGISLGRFIYLLDATMDYKQDLNTGNYNPLKIMGMKPEDMDELLKIEIGKAAVIFERLPIVSDQHLLKNIIYSGVWTEYDSKGLGKKDSDEDEEQPKEGITSK